MHMRHRIPHTPVQLIMSPLSFYNTQLSKLIYTNIGKVLIIFVFLYWQAN